MARCLATPPCNYKANGEVHDHGCPERRKGWADEPAEHVDLYATETAAERARLGAVLEHLIDRDLLDTDGYDEAEADDVTGGSPEWIQLRARIRDGAHDPDRIAEGIGVRWSDETWAPTPELYRRLPEELPHPAEPMPDQPTRCAMCMSGIAEEPTTLHPAA